MIYLIHLFCVFFQELNPSIRKKEQIGFSYVPWCLRARLKSIDMKKLIGGIGVEMKVIKYFLESSRVVKKLNMHLCFPRIYGRKVYHLQGTHEIPKML